MSGPGLSQRLLVAFLVLIASVVLPGAIFAHRWLSRDLTAIERGELVRQAQVLAVELDRSPPADAAAWVAQLPRTDGLRVTLVSPDGQVLADSEVHAEE